MSDDTSLMYLLIGEEDTVIRMYTYHGKIERIYSYVSDTLEMVPQHLVPFTLEESDTHMSQILLLP